MRISINVKDFWLEEGDLEENLKSYIKREVTKEIWKKINDSVEKKITEIVQKEIEQSLRSQITLKTAEVIKTEKITFNPSYGKTEEVTILEYIKKKFSTDSGWHSPDETIKTVAKKFGNELKARFDLMFASRIVENLHTNGLLKESAAKLLINENNTQGD